MAAIESTTQQSMGHASYRRDLGDGLVLRWSTAEDVERVVALYAQVFRPTADAPLNPHIPIWTRDLFSGRHPHIGPGDFALVEDTRTGQIVASTCLLRYRCVYEGIPFPFGRPEIVASLPEYRRRGLIRAIFELIHARSEERGDLVQGITGISYYYRQFGYEYAVALEDELKVYFPAIPALKPGATEPYTLREATPDDIPLLRRLWERAHSGGVVWAEIEEEYWRWAMAGMHPDALERWRVYLIVETPGATETAETAETAGRRVGALILAPGRRSASVVVSGPVIDAGVPLVRVVPSVLRGVQALAETTRPVRPETPPAGAVSFFLSDPELASSLGEIPVVSTIYHYNWYLRVADLPRFLRHIAPALERRLAESAQAGYTGDLTIDFYRGGLRLAFEGGRLTAIEEWQRPLWGEGMAAFPPLVFLQMVFGHRSLDELRHIFPDVGATGDAAALLTALFPKRPSQLMYLD